MSVDRRHFLLALSVATVGAMGLTRWSTSGGQHATAATPVAAEQRPELLPPPPKEARVPLPGGGVLSSLPGDDLLAITVDDGVNSDVVRLYTEFAKVTGVRLTYFVNGAYRSWTENRDLLRPLVDSGQIQLGNHTWSHPDLTKLPLTAVAEELRHTHDFLWKTYGIDARPYFRPPYGAHNANVDKISGELGYTADTLWSGSLEDQVVAPEDKIVAMAGKYFKPGAIVIGHLNHLPVTHVYGQLVDLIRERRLRTVTLNDVYIS
jgi:peptidoglycan/xylan/chitin deacetylase (PgdA/CDA1 family)